MTFVTVHRSIRSVDADQWDSLGDDPFSCSAALTALEEANLPGVEMSYATVSDERGRVVGAAPIARVAIDGQHLTHGVFRQAIGVVRHVDPRFLKTSLMICGTPLSVGNAPFRAAPSADRRAVIAALARATDQLADACGVSWRVFKEFSNEDLEVANGVFGDRGSWTLVPSEPNCRLNIRWPTYEAYLDDMRSDYRYKIRKAARKFARAGIQVENVSLADFYSESLHTLYENVLSRAAVRLEHLTPQFFTGLGRSHGANARLILFKRNGAVIGWVATLLARGIAYDLFHGIDYDELDETDLYFNQLAAVVRWAIDSGAKELSLGQSTEIAKARFGGVAAPLWIAVKHRRALINRGLHAGRQVLFPTRAVPARRVFRDSFAWGKGKSG